MHLALVVDQDARTTYNLAMVHLLQKKVHKQPPAELNMKAIEAELQKTFVTTEGVLALHQRYHKLLRTPKVPRQQSRSLPCSGHIAHGRKSGLLSKPCTQGL
jgi:hypothetical protein